MATNSQRTLVCAVLALAAMVAPTGVAAQSDIRIGYALAHTSHYGAGAQAWGEHVEAATSGKYRFKHFPGSALGGERDMLEGLTLGSLDAVILSTGALSNFVPEVGVVDIPFLFRDAQHARTVLDGPLGQEILAKFTDKGFRALAWGEQGFRHLTNNRRAVQSPQDFRGLKIRTMENPVHITAFRALGALPTPMAWPEVVTGLQQGTIDGQENPISVIVSARLAQVQKHLTLTGHVYSPTVLIVSRKLWDDLSRQDRLAFQQGAIEGAKAMRSFVDNIEQKGVDELRQAGMEVVTSVDNGAFQSSLEPAYKEYAARYGVMLIERIRNTR